MTLQSKPISKGSNIVNRGENEKGVEQERWQLVNLIWWIGNIFFPAWQFDNTCKEQEKKTAGVTSC